MYLTKGELIAIVIVMILWILFGPSAHAATVPTDPPITFGPPTFERPVPPPGPEICLDDYTGRAVLCTELEYGQVEI